MSMKEAGMSNTKRSSSDNNPYQLDYSRTRCSINRIELRKDCLIKQSSFISRFNTPTKKKYANSVSELRERYTMRS